MRCASPSAMRITERDAQARGIAVLFDDRSAVAAMGDRRALCQVVVNLVSNAIKYNRPGGRVRVRVQSGAEARIEVHDTGPGLTEEQIGRLYRPFERLGIQDSQVKGHGLGLSICKELVGSMGGEMRVRSRVGQGTTFTVLLPLHQTACSLTA